jgi:hypothetical protein
MALEEEQPGRVPCGFLLCDPALVLPPDQAEGVNVDFWRRLIEWSADGRVRLGANSFDLVVAVLDDLGWPIFDPPGCPKALRREAGRSINVLLTRVRASSRDDLAVIPTPSLSPKHVGGDLIEEAIARDAVELWIQGLTGIATSFDHWLPPGRELVITPPPPPALELLGSPEERTVIEMNASVRNYFATRRLTVIGGWNASSVRSELDDRFSLSSARLRWLEGEKGKTMKLDLLDTLAPDHDVVVCVAGHIGHPESGLVKTRCKTLGVELRLVEAQSEIVEVLLADFQRDV